MKRANLILGMPASGKSTYIAALGHILLTQDVETELRLEVGEDETYIVELQQRWLKYEELVHTPTGGDNWITFHLVSNLDETQIELELPDFSGESLRNAVVTGIFPVPLFEALRDSAGIFLFTSAAGKQDDILLNDLFGMFPIPPAPEYDTEAGNSASDDDSRTDGPQSTATGQSVFDPMEMPEEPKIVQLLQLTAGFASHRRKLVIMISAWDIVASDSTLGPAAWIEQNRPMLWQYLNYNPSQWDVRIYGVSAQGGRIPEDKAVLKKYLRASERVKLVGHAAGPHDLTAPLSWMANK